MAKLDGSTGRKRLTRAAILASTGRLVHCRKVNNYGRLASAVKLVKKNWNPDASVGARLCKVKRTEKKSKQ